MSSTADPSRWLTDFFFWLFRKGWATVIALSIVWYYALVLFFAGLIAWSAKLDSDCIRVGDEELGESGHRLVSCSNYRHFLSELEGRENGCVLRILSWHQISCMQSYLWTHFRCHGTHFLQWGKNGANMSIRIEHLRWTYLFHISYFRLHVVFLRLIS